MYARREAKKYPRRHAGGVAEEQCTKRQEKQQGTNEE